MSRICRFVMLVVTVLLLVRLLSDWATAADPPQPQQFEDKPEFITPKPRSEAERDRMEALALFGAARMKQQQNKHAEALRLYERALRYDPDSLQILEQIVSLAVRLNRVDAMARHALQATELETINTRALRVLADILAQRGDVETALEIYERLEKAQTDAEKKTPSYVLMQMVMGRLYHQQGEHKKAAEAFARVLNALENANKFGLKPEMRGALLGDAAETYVIFGESFLEAGRIKEAREAFRTAHEVDRDKNAQAYHQALILLAQDKPAEARAELQKYLDAQASGQSAKPYELLGEILEELDKSGEFTKQLADAQTKDPKNAPLAHFLAERYAAEDQTDRAVPLYELVVKLDQADEGDDFQPLVRSSLLALILARHEQKDYPALLDALIKLGDLDGDLDSLDEDLKKLAADKPTVDAVLKLAAEKLNNKQLDYGGQLAAASLALASGRLESAATYFEAALESKPEKSAELILMWGLGLMIADHNAEAARVFQIGIDRRALPEQNPAFLYYKASALEMAGQTDEALKAAKAAVEVNEGNPRLLSRVAWINYHAKRYEEAIKQYTALVNKFDDVPEPDVREVVKEARLVLSNLCLIVGDIAQAEEWLEQILDEFPGDISASNDLGYLWADQGKNLNRALEMVQQAVDSEPENAAYRDSLGWALFKMGRHEEALKHMEKAVELEGEPDAVIVDHLGDVYHALGKNDQARKAWQQAVEKFDPERDAEKIQATKKKLEGLKAQ